MATRTSRKGGASTSHTPVVSSPAVSRVAHRSPSPLSPARLSRLDEKKSIQNLNDRLAMYIDAVRNHDIEVSKLRQEKSTVEESHTTEIIEVKGLFSKEIAQIRKALDQVSKEKAKLEIEAEKANRESREAKGELSSKEKLLAATDRELKSLQSKYNDALTRSNNAESELKTLRPENAKLKDKLEDAKRNLEDETLKRVELQNQLLSLEESVKFEKTMLEKQLNETRVRKKMEISEIDGRLKEEYDRKIEDSLADLRNTFEVEAEEKRQQYSRESEEKLAKLRAALDAEKLNVAGSFHELSEFRTKFSSLSSRNSELESANAALQKAMADRLRDMDDRAASFRAEMARKEAELRNKDDQIEATVKDYNDLMEIKVALDMEIAVYRKLLEGEESRLGISQQGSPESSGSSSFVSGRGIKRKRTVIEEEDLTEMVSDHTGKGTVFIEPVEKNAKAIRVTNRSKDAINITGWSLSNVSDGSEGNEFTYKFPRGVNLGPDESCTVWSSDSQQDHSPPNNMVMKKGGWVIGSANKTVLVNKDGEEEACRTSREEHRIAGSYLSGHGTVRSRTLSQSGAADKSCSIM